MERYRVGQVVHLWRGQSGVSRRVEVTRPDGSLLTIDWDRKPVSLRPSMAGTWRWRMYLRDGRDTRMEVGSFEVSAHAVVGPIGRMRLGLARRLGRG